MALRRVRELCRTRNDLSHVELLHREADNFTGLEPGAFDTVVVNSVAQYLPSMGYLSRVLTGALGVLAAGGRVLVGDVRSLPLLGAYHAEVQLHRSGETVTVEEVGRRAREELEREKELVIGPAFFEFAMARDPREAAVDILLSGASAQPVSHR